MTYEEKINGGWFENQEVGCANRKILATTKEKKSVDREFGGLP